MRYSLLLHVALLLLVVPSLSATPASRTTAGPDSTLVTVEILAGWKSAGQITNQQYNDIWGELKAGHAVFYQNGEIVYSVPQKGEVPQKAGGPPSSSAAKIPQASVSSDHDKSMSKKIPMDVVELSANGIYDFGFKNLLDSGAFDPKVISKSPGQITFHHRSEGKDTLTPAFYYNLKHQSTAVEGKDGRVDVIDRIDVVINKAFESKHLSYILSYMAINVQERIAYISYTKKQPTKDNYDLAFLEVTVTKKDPVTKKDVVIKEFRVKKKGAGPHIVVTQVKKSPPTFQITQVMPIPNIILGRMTHPEGKIIEQIKIGENPITDTDAVATMLNLPLMQYFLLLF